LPRPGRVLGRALGFVGRIMLKVGVTRRLVWVAAGIAAAVILVLALFAVALLGW
jgi:hypothetical protein